MRWIKRGRGRPRHPDVLTPAEWRVLEDVRRGWTNQEIADDLGVSVNTVRAHVSSMLAKLDLPDRHALGRWEGSPARASRAALDRMGIAVWLRWSAGAVALLTGALALWSVMEASRPGESSVGAPATAPAGAPSPTPPATEASATETLAPTTPPQAPFRLDFGPGEVIDVAPAALFVGPGGATTAWVFPDHDGSDLGISPGGRFILWRHGGQVRIFSTENGSDQAIEVAEVVAYAPDDSGFIASNADDFIVSAYDGAGRVVRSLWRGPGPRTADWGRFGIAIGGKGVATRVSVHRSDGSQTDYLVNEASGGMLSLRWAPDGGRLAVVTGGWVRVFDLDGAQLWEQRGEFFGNPRWSPDGEHLFVNAMPASGGDVAYMFTAEGELLWRYRSADQDAWPGYGYSCLGDVWIDQQTIGIGIVAISVDGTVEDPPSGTLDPTPGDLGIDVAPHLGIDHVRLTGTDVRVRLTDGRYVFQTSPHAAGRGGCAEGITVLVTGPLGLERPPFFDAHLFPDATPAAAPTSP